MTLKSVSIPSFRQQNEQRLLHGGPTAGNGLSNRKIKIKIPEGNIRKNLHIYQEITRYGKVSKYYPPEGASPGQELPWKPD